jgi:ABC-type uncharacterized transport system auxiliary subunit
MEQFSAVIKRPGRNLWRNLFLLLSAAVIAGCVSSGKPQAPVENYLLDYPAPIFEKRTKIDDTIRVSRFTIATVYNNNNMIFRQDNYALDSFNYSRWAANPADMVSDNLLRDLQASGFFRAVFSRYVVDEGRYIVQGGIEEFFLKIDKKGKSAIISLAITLKDTKQREAGKRIMFQKRYAREETLPEQSPQGYCQAMSSGWQKLSPQIVDDVYQAIQKAENK